MSKYVKANIVNGEKKKIDFIAFCVVINIYTDGQEVPQTWSIT